MLGVSQMVILKKKFYSLISGYESVRILEKNEIESINVILRGASLRFLLTRTVDQMKNNKNNFVKKKNPNEFYRILKFHISVKDEFKYRYSK